jgi:ATP-dependent Lon protease
MMLPARNQKDLEDVPDAARKQVRFAWLERVDDAVAAALNLLGESQKTDAPIRIQPASGRQAARSK